MNCVTICTNRWQNYNTIICLDLLRLFKWLSSSLDSFLKDTSRIINWKCYVSHTVSMLLDMKGELCVFCLKCWRKYDDNLIRSHGVTDSIAATSFKALIRETFEPEALAIPISSLLSISYPQSDVVKSVEGTDIRLMYIDCWIENLLFI